MFMKQYNYKPRSNSTSSTGSQGQAEAAAALKDAKPASQSSEGSTIAQAAAGRRRSSATEKFANLNAYKRTSESHGDTKAAIADQKVGGQGILGGMWNSFTKGS